MNLNYHEEFFYLLNDNILEVYEKNYLRIITGGDSDESSSKYRDLPLNKDGFCLVTLATLY